MGELGKDWLRGVGHAECVCVCVFVMGEGEAKGG